MKRIVKTLTICLLIACFCIGLMPIPASAASGVTKYYKTYGSTREILGSNQGNVFDGPPDCLDLYMYGDSYSGSGTLYNDALINWDTIHFYADLHGNVDRLISFALYKPTSTNSNLLEYENLTTYGKQSRLIHTSSNLSDGYYEAFVITHYETQFLFIVSSYEYGYSFYFTLDRTPPTITGASTSTTYTNAGFTVSAADENGVEGLYIKSPTSSGFSKHTSNTYSLTSGTKGLYSFYAIDKAGNKTAYHYVYYDTDKPTGYIADLSDTKITSAYTTRSFKYIATDPTTYVNKKQVLRLDKSSWIDFTGSIIAGTDPDGIYKFRCYDKAGNVSDTSSVTLDTVGPIGTVSIDGTIMKNGQSKTGSKIKYTATDATSGLKSYYVKKPGTTSFVSYTSGTELSGAGKYSFYSIDKAGNPSDEITVTMTAAASGPTTYTVSYNANGGSGAPSAQTKIKGEDLPISSITPVRTGYTFLGWTNSASSSLVLYTPGEMYMDDASITLYAVWEVSTYRVTYNANGGSGAPSAQTKKYGVDLTLSTKEPTKTGATFRGWATNASASQPSYQPGSTFSGNYSTTLYALWTQNAETYTITYNANGGSDAPDPQTKIEDVPLSIPYDTPTRDGFTFMGWGTSSVSTIVSYNPGGSYNANASATLYAVWQRNAKTYTVSYNANGGTNAPASQVKVENVDLTLTSDTPKRTGYTFKGWGITSGSATAKYQPGDTYTENRSRTLYAIWTINTYKITYNANGGSGAPATQTKTHNIPATISNTIPTRTGFEFLGWSTSFTATTATYKPGDIYSANSSLKLYAVWKSLETYTITYNLNGPTTIIPSQTKYKGIDIQLSSTVPVTDGRTFLGWGTSKYDTVPTYNAGDWYREDQSVTLYAVWQQNLERYLVIFNMNGGKSGPSTQQKVQGVPLVLPMTEPYRDGYDFIGWNSSSTAIVSEYDPGDTYDIDAPITLYAVWGCKHLNTTRVFATDCQWNDICDQCGAVIASGYIHSQLEYGEWVYDTNLQHKREVHCIHGDYSSVERAVHTISTRYELFTETQHKKYSYCEECNSVIGSKSAEAHHFTETVSGGNRIRTCSDCGYTESEVMQYTVTYHANGGEGAPGNQTKVHGVNLTLSSITPSRNGYIFKGWAKTNDATEPEYSGGDSYTENSDLLLYAVWEENKCDFSVLSISVDETELYRFGTAHVRVKVKNLDPGISYSAVPVQIYFDGVLVGGTTVNLIPNGTAIVVYQVGIGDTEGNHTYEARINWQERNKEINPDNNTKSVNVTILGYVYETSVTPVFDSADMYEGDDVILSFIVNNDGDADITPDSHNSAVLTISYQNGTDTVIVDMLNKADVVIPKHGSNLIYFKWHVPSGLSGKELTAKCVVNGNGNLAEANLTNNEVTITASVSVRTSSQTENTRFESQKPTWYTNTNPPAEQTNASTWNEWVYENGVFTMKTYGIKLDLSRPEIIPEENCETAVYENGRWIMKSGYGIKVSYSSSFVNPEGYMLPSSDAYTAVQSVKALLPENMYSDVHGKYVSLEKGNDAYVFPENADAHGSERVHFIPICVDDGNYIVTLAVQDIWTPTGKISAVRHGNTIVINGTLYDDWYQV